MAERNFEQKFWDIAVYIAADDPRLRRAQKYVMLGDEEGLEPGESDTFDHEEIREMLAVDYGLTDQQVTHAFDLCEKAIEEEIFNAGA